MSVPAQPQSQPGDFNAVKKSVIDLLNQPEYDDGSAGPVIVRLAWYVAQIMRSPSSSLPDFYKY